MLPTTIHPPSSRGGWIKQGTRSQQQPAPVKQVGTSHLGKFTEFITQQRPSKWSIKGHDTARRQREYNSRDHNYIRGRRQMPADRGREQALPVTLGKRGQGREKVVRRRGNEDDDYSVSQCHLLINLSSGNERPSFHPLVLLVLLCLLICCYKRPRTGRRDYSKHRPRPAHSK